MAKKTVVALIQRFLRCLLKEGISVERAYLYGSYARGEENEESDIDVMVISEIYDNLDDRTVGKTWRISRSVDVRIEPIQLGKSVF
jgi:predicted nucleotidyltransferase